MLGVSNTTLDLRVVISNVISMSSSDLKEVTCMGKALWWSYKTNRKVVCIQAGTTFQYLHKTYLSQLLFFLAVCDPAHSGSHMLAQLQTNTRYHLITCLHLDLSLDMEVPYYSQLLAPAPCLLLRVLLALQSQSRHSPAWYKSAEQSLYIVSCCSKIHLHILNVQACYTSDACCRLTRSQEPGPSCL